MLVFGDRVRICFPAVELQAIGERIEMLARMAPGLERHSHLVSALLAAGELAQAVADDRMQERTRDSRDASADALMALAVWLARQVWLSHASGYRHPFAGDAGPIRSRAADAWLPVQALARAPEGFAEYALYPEQYGAAAAAVFSDTDAPLVIGIRSIGTTLGAMVAAVSGSSRAGQPLTVRPIGHPFARRLELAADVRRELTQASQRCVAIVDEGPGLSGSSFAAVLGALADASIPDARIHVFASRRALGPLATSEVTRRWRAVARHCVSFDELFVAGERGAASLRTWTEALTGDQNEPPVDIGGGRWRSLLFRVAEHWPPAHTQLERRKFLLHSSRKRFLARFVGLGRHGEERLRRATRLADAGFSPAVLGLCQGFLVQPWIDGAAPLSEGRCDVSRPHLVARVADYLAFRAAELRTDVGRGATPRELLGMAVTNAGEALGTAAGESLRCFEPWLAEIERAARPIEVDARLHAWEWLVLPNGTLLKTDAIDHCDSHDLIGCQDVAWDIAGAEIELDLAPSEVGFLQRRLAAEGAQIPSAMLAFYSTCYLAFQLGAASLAARAMEPEDSLESQRLKRASAKYTARMAALIAGDARRPFARAGGER